MEEENEILEEKIKELIEEVRPFLHMDGGDIEFVKFENNYVYVKLRGSCSECAFVNDTLEAIVHGYLQEQVPEIEGIINIPL